MQCAGEHLQRGRFPMEQLIWAGLSLLFLLFLLSIAQPCLSQPQVCAQSSISASLEELTGRCGIYSSAILCFSSSVLQASLKCNNSFPSQAHCSGKSINSLGVVCISLCSSNSPLPFLIPSLFFSQYCLYPTLLTPLGLGFFPLSGDICPMKSTVWWIIPPFFKSAAEAEGRDGRGHQHHTQIAWHKPRLSSNSTNWWLIIN